MPNYNFRKDLPVAHATERQVSKFLCDTRGMTFLSECNNSDYDLLMQLKNGRRITIEIKEDFTCKKTGNVGIEYECRGRPSGISVSKADYYLYKVHEPTGNTSLYVIATNHLRELIDNKMYFRSIIGGDEGSNSKNHLFKLETVKENFKFIGTI
jgi:hypothetical protein